MKEILVTGGAGFIGGNFINYMLSKYDDYKIINLDKLTYASNPDFIDKRYSDRYRLVVGDICNKAIIEEIFNEETIDYVVNFAAESHVDRSIEAPEIFIQTNVYGTQVLVDCAKKHWTIGRDEFGYPRYKANVKYLQVSTDEVYGALGKEGFFTEETPLAPNSPYSASKAAADLLVRSYFQTFHMPVNITRCSNNYGPNQHKEKLIPLMIFKASRDQSLPVYGDGMQVRDWLYVEDHCEAIDCVLQEGIIGEVYNIGGDNEQYNLNIVRTILDKLGKGDDLIEFVTDRLGHDRRYAIDHSKISQQVGWKPITSLWKGWKNHFMVHQMIDAY